MNRNIKVLFADDEKIYAEALPKISNPSGVNYVFDFVHTVEDAIAKLEERFFDYDVIVVDLRFQVEKLAGLKIFKYLAKQRIEIPSVIITAYSNEKTLKECLKERPYKFLDKPFEFEMLKKAIQEVLKKSSAQKKVRKPQVPTIRKSLERLEGQSKLDILIAGLESLTSDQYETIISELPMIRSVIEEEESCGEKPKIDPDWKKTKDVPLPILNIGNLYLEYQVNKLLSGTLKKYGPFVYIRWMQDGKLEQHYLGKLEKMTGPNVIRKLYEKYEKEEEFRKLDRYQSIPILYRKYCQSSKPQKAR